MSLTDRILPRHILSRVRVSVRPSNFFIPEKLPNYRGTQVAYAFFFYFTDPATGYEWGSPMNASGAGDHGWAPMNSDRLWGGRWRRLCVHACACTRVRVCVRAHACARVRVCTRACVHAWCVCNIRYNIWPWLIIIIKIITLYFIQIRHSNDFPSTGTPASMYNVCKHNYIIFK